MARRTKEITIAINGRDKGKKFEIVEMSAFDTEKWSTLAVSTIINRASPQMRQLLISATYAYVSYINVNEIDNLQNAGKIAIEEPTKLLAKTLAEQFFELPPGEVGSVVDQLLNCCYLVTEEEGNVYKYPVMSIVDQIEEASTLTLLKREAFKMHTDFFLNYMTLRSMAPEETKS